MSTLHGLDLRDRVVVVVGGGPGAADRASALAAAGARVRLYADSLCEDLTELVAADRVQWAGDTLAESDLTDAWLLSTPEATEAEQSTLAAWAQRHKVFHEQVSATAYDIDSLVTERSMSLRDNRTHGKVVLVGGGPGADDLITVRGRRELARADVVVTDRLAPVGLLRSLGSNAEVVNVGKTPYHHPVPQPEINALLVERAQRGDYVVRLKGGDPFVLGRGGEEWLACREAGVEVEVVPGVSSAYAAPMAGLVPVTHRGVASGVLMVSGHDEVEPEVLAAWPHTIVVLMGMGRLEELTTALVRAGKDAATPAAVVHRAWTEQQRTVRGTLADLPGRVREAGVGNPAVIVIGAVVDAIEGP
ncbi:uroporphyrinogen-III C-methyltransferase [Calidifontibacter sp. DB0510]|uniref:uroporphyrinogen-III C-methyltransferase n=1 Tax=Metallococcus carri TaxID=1656884 RepID=A0A967B960_9MICO|nr:uroporphyrinogen-III C-methyltransferase [Metallococcus carri]NHN57131.1 uroporphyrinogen-III C-methyltransferase [Metallococcus carri]NOP39000.1 uroporphyrinogen-III C-methyltransferase [Calidifontibacter sp. DB2511S]